MHRPLLVRSSPFHGYSSFACNSNTKTSANINEFHHDILTHVHSSFQVQEAWPACLKNCEQPPLPQYQIFATLVQVLRNHTRFLLKSRRFTNSLQKKSRIPSLLAQTPLQIF